MKKVMKWIGIVLVGLLSLIVLALLGVYFLSNQRINKQYDIQPEAVAIPTDAASLAEGKRIFTFRGCVDCHKEDGRGSVFIDDPALGRIAASNLTAGRGGVAPAYTDLDWVRAILHGVGPDGLPLQVMPSQEYNGLNDADLGAVIAYIKSLPPVDNKLPPNQLGLLGRALTVANQLPLLPAEEIDHNAPRPVVIASSETVEYGAYLAQSCTGCHGAGLSGGPIPGVPAEPPYPANLTPDTETGLAGWQRIDFVRVMREGKRPDGTDINPVAMPWPAFSQMTDTELAALWLYLETLPPTPYGNR